MGGDMSDEFGPWVQHDGKGCPVKGQFVRSVDAAGIEMEHLAGMLVEKEGIIPVDSWDWDQCNRYDVWHWRILRYRIRRPKGLTILENLIADIPQPVEVGG